MDDEKLIQFVKEREVIYNKRKSGYKLIEVKAKAWREISVGMKASVEECTKRWTTLRDRFVRECKRIDQPTGSGVGLGTTWDLFDSMLFLKDHTQPRKTKCSINILEECSNDMNSTPTLYAEEDIIIIDPENAEQHSVPSTERANRKRKACKENSEESQLSEAVKTFKNYVSGCTSATSDEFSSFANIIKCKLQGLPRYLSNKGMQDILNYLINLENFCEGTSSELPNLH